MVLRLVVSALFVMLSFSAPLSYRFIPLSAQHAKEVKKLPIGARFRSSFGIKAGTQNTAESLVRSAIEAHRRMVDSSELNEVQQNHFQVKQHDSSKLKGVIRSSDTSNSLPTYDMGIPHGWTDDVHGMVQSAVDQTMSSPSTNSHQYNGQQHHGTSTLKGVARSANNNDNTPSYDMGIPHGWTDDVHGIVQSALYQTRKPRKSNVRRFHREQDDGTSHLERESEISQGPKRRFRRRSRPYNGKQEGVTSQLAGEEVGTTSERQLTEGTIGNLNSSTANAEKAEEIKAEIDRTLWELYKELTAYNSRSAYSPSNGKKKKRTASKWGGQMYPFSLENEDS